MALSSDVLSDRQRLKKEIRRWRMLALVFLFFAFVIISMRNDLSILHTPYENYIARVNISDVIEDDYNRDQMFDELIDDKNVSAVLIRMDSPGGTTVGGEELYRKIKALNSVKPVVVVMRTLCTSACYMASLGAEQVFARASSLTASIGVILDFAEFTGLAEKLGIEPITIKSGSLKASPSPTEKLLPEQRAYIQSVIDDSFALFLSIVKKRRNLSDETIALIKDGRVMTGQQAYKLKLVDALGGERDALNWLYKTKKIDKKTPIYDVEPEEDDKDWLSQLEQSAGNLIFGSTHQRLDGLKSIWQPTLK